MAGQRLAGKTGAIKGVLSQCGTAAPPTYRHGKDDLLLLTIPSAGTTLPYPEGSLWLAILFTAGLLEIGWAIGLKYTEGFSRLVPSVLTLAAMAGSVILLGIALKTLPIGTAYAVWTGIGAVGTAALGIILLGEPATAMRLASIGLIVSGIVGLKLVG